MTTPLRSSAASVRTALLSAALLGACTTDLQLSLGHHEPSLVPAPPAIQDAAQVPPPLDAGAPPPTGGAAGMSSGGTGGTSPAPPQVDSSVAPVVEDAAVLPILCGASVYIALLDCEISSGIFPPFGGEPPPPMSTMSDLVIEPIVGQTDRAQVSGRLSFEAWGNQFDARIVGMLDCEARLFHADIVDGTFVPLMPLSGPDGSFVGALDAQLDPLTGDLFGVWFHTPQMGGPRCNGTWIAASVSNP